MKKRVLPVLTLFEEFSCFHCVFFNLETNKCGKTKIYIDQPKNKGCIHILSLKDLNHGETVLL